MNTSSPRRIAIATGLLVSGSIGLAPSALGQGFEHHKLLPVDGAANDLFGSAVATDGVRVAVGAPPAGALGSDSGSAYVFAADTGDPSFEVLPLDGAPGDRFGASIAVDGDRVFVGAPLADPAGLSSGAVYVFDATSGAQLAKLQPDDAAPNSQFGTAVAADDGLLVVGALQAAYLFDVATGQQLEELVPDGGPPVGGSGIAILDGGFGQAVDIDGGRIVVGAKSANGGSLYSGAAYVFDTSGNELQMVSAGAAFSQFGGSVGIDGTTVVVGAKYSAPNGKDSGQAYLFDVLTGAMTGNLVPSDGHIFAHFGSSVGIDGALVAVGAEQDNGVGTPDSGSVYLYSAVSAEWIEKLTASDAASLDDLGVSVAVSKGVVVAGATGDDDNGSSSGSVYQFDEAGTVTAMSECFGNAGSLELVSGLAVAGQSLVFRMEDAQAAAELGLFALSATAAPGWPTCGSSLGNAGELLVGLPTLLTFSAPYAGGSLEFSLDIPPVSGLVGFQLYHQGAFLAPTSASEPVRLTGGLEVQFGGYL